MKRNRLIPWLLPVAIVATAIVLFFLPGRPVQTRQVPSPAAGTPAAPPHEPLAPIEDLDARFQSTDATPESPLRYGYRKGAILRYAVEARRTVTQKSAIIPSHLPNSATASSEPLSGSTSMEFQLSGILDLHVYETGPEEIVTGWKLSQLTVLVGGEAAQGLHRFQELEQYLSEAEAVVRMSPSGAIREVGFPHATDAQVQGLYRSLIADQHIQFSASPLATWQETETDTVGRFTAAYSARRGLDANRTPSFRIEKRNLGYLALHTLINEIQGGDDVEARDSSVAHFDPAQGRLTYLSHQGHTRLQAAAELEVETRSSTRFAFLRLLSETAGSEPAIAHRGGLAPEGLGGLADTLVQDRFLKRAKEENLTLASLYERLGKTLGESQPSTAELQEVFLALKNLFLYDGEQVAAARTLLRDESARRTEACRFIVAALGAAGTPAAQSCLAECVLDADAPESFRQNACVSAGMMTALPTRELKDALLNTSENEPDLRVQATALGAVGGLAATCSAAGSEDEAKELVAAVARKRDLRNDNSWHALWVVALGNTHHRDALTHLEPELKHTDVNVAAQAAESLGFIDDPGADRKLLELASDKNQRPEVLLGALRALGQTPGPESRKTLEALLKDPREDVRKTAKLTLQRLSTGFAPDGTPLEVQNP